MDNFFKDGFKVWEFDPISNNSYKLVAVVQCSWLANVLAACNPFDTVIVPPLFRMDGSNPWANGSKTVNNEQYNMLRKYHQEQTEAFA